MTVFVLVMLPATAMVVWAIAVERRLRALDEDAGRAMQQVGVREASRLDTVAVLLELSCDYTHRQAPQMEAARGQRCVLTTAATAADVAAQDALAEEALRYIGQTRECCPAFARDAAYVRAVAELDCCRQMLSASRRRYNEAAARFNAAQHRFPDQLIAGAMGLHDRKLLPETAA